MINLILNIQKMNVQQKIEKWCRNERFVHYANERISEELVYAPNHRIDPEYEELDEAIDDLTEQLEWGRKKIASFDENS